MKMFVLKRKVVDFISTHEAAKAELCSAMNIGRTALYYHLNGNVPNGSLTKWNALQVISKYYNQPVEELVETPKYQEVA